MNKLTVSSSPHIRENVSTSRIMLDVIIALLPTAIVGAVIFGWKALAVILTTTATAVLTEFVYNLIVKKEQTIKDLSAVVTGLLLGLSLHADTPIWQCVIGSVFAIVVVKALFGGLGCNFANPAITGRIFLFIAFSETVGGGASPVVQPLGDPYVGTHATGATVDVVTGSTPLELLAWDSVLPSLKDMFFGIRGGAIGEACALAIIVGYLYLVFRGVIKFETPLVYVATVFLGALIITGSARLALYHVLAGGLLLAAVFMITDYVTTPITRVGKMIFGLGAGVLTVLIRFYGAYPEGVSFAVLFMNILSPYIEKWTAPRALGGAKK